MIMIKMNFPVMMNMMTQRTRALQSLVTLDINNNFIALAVI